MRTRRIIGVVFAVGILCFCFAGSIDNSATRPWVRSLVDYVTGTVVPTSSVAYATSAGTATWAARAASATNISFYDTFLSQDFTLYGEPATEASPMPSWRCFGFNGDLLIGGHPYAGTSSNNSYRCGFGEYSATPTFNWHLYRPTSSGSVWLQCGRTTNYVYAFGPSGNVITGGMTGVILSGTFRDPSLTNTWGFTDPAPTSALQNVQWAYWPSTGTVRGVRGNTLSGLVVADFVYRNWTNASTAYTIAYTGLTFGAVATNVPFTYPLVAGNYYGLISTNVNAATNWTAAMEWTP